MGICLNIKVALFSELFQIVFKQVQSNIPATLNIPCEIRINIKKTERIKKQSRSRAQAREDAQREGMREERGEVRPLWRDQWTNRDGATRKMTRNHPHRTILQSRVAYCRLLYLELSRNDGSELENAYELELGFQFVGVLLQLDS